jgi:hypothetical protein
MSLSEVCGEAAHLSQGKLIHLRRPGLIESQATCRGKGTEGVGVGSRVCARTMTQNPGGRWLA